MNRLRELRREKELTQVQMAAIFQIPQGAYSNYELGKINLGREKALQFARFFHVSLDYLLGASNFRSFPIMGKVAAGKGCWAEDDIEGYADFMLPEGAEAKDFFALRVVGESMVPYYLPNDLLLCQRGDYTPENNGKYIVLVGDEATVKMVHQLGYGIKLVAYNKDVFPDKIYSWEDCEQIPVKIIAKVRQLQRME